MSETGSSGAGSSRVATPAGGGDGTDGALDEAVESSGRVVTPAPAGTGRGRGGRGPRTRDRDRGPGRLARLAVFYREVVAELRKVIWPTRKELVTYTTVVLVFVTAMVAIVAGLDFAFTEGVLAIFG